MLPFLRGKSHARVIDAAVVGAGGKARLESRIKKFKPHLICDLLTILLHNSISLNDVSIILPCVYGGTHLATKTTSKKKKKWKESRMGVYTEVPYGTALARGK